MAREFDLNPVTFITVGTIGPPGQRVFHLQAGTEDDLVTLTIEKMQAAALAEGTNQLLEELSEKLGLPEAKASEMDLELHEPILPAFRVAQLGIGFDEASGMIVVMAQELLLEDEAEEPSIARFFATPDQMRAFSEHAEFVVSQGRPICPLCDQPIDPDGHFCPKRNGHGRKVLLA